VERGNLRFETDELTIRKGETVALRVELLADRVEVRQGQALIGKEELPSGESSPTTVVGKEPEKRERPPNAVSPFDSAQAKRLQEAWSRYLGIPIEKEVALANGTKVPFMLIPPGEFRMGSTPTQQTEILKLAKATVQSEDARLIAAESPQHPVTLTQPFYMGKYEVTQGQWKSITGQNPSLYKDNDSNPVEQVGWTDVESFLSKLNQVSQERGMTFTLPTEAQWEFACRAGTETSWHCGDDIAKLPEYGWIRSTARNRTHPVGQLRPNAFGLHDMYGNVWEWCADWFDSKYYSKSPSRDPRGPDSGRHRAHRGGGMVDPAASCRSAYRYRSSVDTRHGHHGFRLAIAIDISKLTSNAMAGEPAEPDASGLSQHRQGEPLNVQAEKKAVAALTELGGQVRKSPFSEGGDVYEVMLAKTRITNQGLAHLKSLPNVYILRLSDTQVGDPGLVHLKGQTKLGMLLLKNTQVTDKGLEHLIGLNTLYGLDLGGTRVSDAGMEKLQKLPELTTLYLSETQLSDSGVKRLSEMTKLKVLDLSGTQITDAAVVHLKTLSNLQVLGVVDTKLSEQRVKELQAALPKCKIRVKDASQRSSQDKNAGTYTYYPMPATVSGKVLQVSVDVSVHQMAESIVSDRKLFFPAMQVNLGPKVRGENDGGHIGLQVDGGEIATNWGGYFLEGTTPETRFPPFYNRNIVPNNENTRGNKIKYSMSDTTYGSYDVLVEHFDPGTYTQVNRKGNGFLKWKTGRWYRLIVFRGRRKKAGYWPWMGFIKVLDAKPYKSYFIGTLYSKADHIESWLVWTETNFNDGRKFDVRFSYPKYRTTTSMPLEHTQTEVMVPSLGGLAVSNNRHNTVVVPNRELAEGVARTTWHRNGLPIPPDAYKSKQHP
jgi:formylglycine-generating enzyme required for sulfatase activity